MPALFVCYWTLAAESKVMLPLLFALFFSWAGDVLLIFTAMHPVFFLAGLCSFFLAHSAYITIFIKQGKRIIWDKVGIIVLAIAIANLTIMLNVLLPYLKLDLIIPVVAYGGILSLLMVTSLSLRERLKKHWEMLLAGIILFIFSDMLIAFRQFRSELISFLPVASFWIMLTYIFAQYLIVRALSKIGNAVQT